MESTSFRTLAEVRGLDIRQRNLVNQIIDLIGAISAIESSVTKGDARTSKMECNLKNGILLTLTEEQAPGRREMMVEARWNNQVVFGLAAEADDPSDATARDCRAVRTEYQPGEWESTLEARWSLIYAL